ncbi:porin [Psittacicella melopsittaci]|nr:porin [Psittacicella melopsittaci]
MKKTLLTLALAGLVGSAFANTTVYQSDVARLYVDGYARYVYGYEKSKVENSNEDTTKGSYARYRFQFGGDFKVADSTAFGFKVRLQNNFWKDLTVKNRNLTTDVTTRSHEGEGTQYFAFDRAFVYLSNDNFGRLSLGRQVTVADGAASSDLEFLTFDPALQANFRTSGNKVAYYTSPVFNNFVFEYSYAETKYNRKVFRITDERVVQNAFAGTYAFSTGTAVKATVAFENHRNNGYNTKELKGYEVAVVQQLGDVSLAAAYDYVRTQNKDGSAQNTVSTDTHHSVVVKGFYNLNQYFQPYAGVTYQRLDTESNNTKTNVWGGYLGAQSDVYQYDSFKVRVFGEAVYLHYSTKANATGDKTTTKAPALAAGVKVFF